jgi:hypothetical protein
MIVSLRCLDTFAKIEGSWCFADRKLLLDCSETPPSTPATLTPADKICRPRR